MRHPRTLAEAQKDADMKSKYDLKMGDRDDKFEGEVKMYGLKKLHDQKRAQSCLHAEGNQ